MKLHRSRMILATGLGIVVCAGGARDTTLRVVSDELDCVDQGSDNNITGSKHSVLTVIQGIGLHHPGSNAQTADGLSWLDISVEGERGVASRAPFDEASDLGRTPTRPWSKTR